MNRSILTIKLTIIVSIFFSCQFNSSNSWKNETIPALIKNKIGSLNSNLINNIEKGNIDEIKRMFSKPMLEHTTKSKFSDELTIFSEIINSDSFTVIDEFYTKNSNTNATNTLIGDQYTFGYTALNKEMYVSIIEIESHSNSSYLLGIVYGKYNSNWEINILQIGQYKLDGKNAIAFLNQAKKQYFKDHFVDAANNIFLADQLLFPLNEYWTYKKHDEIKSMFETVIAEVDQNFTFPLELEEIRTKPQLLSITPELFANGIFPIISYKTNIDIKDTIKLRKEYLDVNKSINLRFKGIRDENTSIVYKAWEEIPDGKTKFHNYSFVHKN